MGDSNELLPPTTGDFAPTPSGLTPNTRTEAEAALSHNSSAQTDAAAPTTPLAAMEDLQMTDGNTDEATRAYRRPPGPVRTSSNNYEKALNEFRKQSSVSTTYSRDTVPENEGQDNITGAPTTASPSTGVAFPPPGQGVVPLHTGVGSGQAEVVKKARKASLSLGTLGRQPSWSQNDFKHVLSAGLMSPVETKDAGYGSGSERK